MNYEKDMFNLKWMNDKKRYKKEEKKSWILIINFKQWIVY